MSAGREGRRVEFDISALGQGRVVLDGADVSRLVRAGPVEAAESLARQLLTGAKCKHCNGLVALGAHGALFLGSEDRPMRLADGSAYTVEEARSRPLCRWTRRGAQWLAGCAESARAGSPSTAAAPNRAARRAAERRKGRR